MVGKPQDLEFRLVFGLTLRLLLGFTALTLGTVPKVLMVSSNSSFLLQHLFLYSKKFL